MVTNISHSVTNNLTGHRMQLAETLSYKHDDNFFTREKTSQVKCWWNHDVDDNDDFNGDGSVIFTAPCWRTCHNHIPWHFPDRILKRICGSKNICTARWHWDDDDGDGDGDDEQNLRRTPSPSPSSWDRNSLALLLISQLSATGSHPWSEILRFWNMNPKR